MKKRKKEKKFKVGVRLGKKIENVWYRGLDSVCEWWLKTNNLLVVNNQYQKIALWPSALSFTWSSGLIYYLVQFLIYSSYCLLVRTHIYIYRYIFIYFFHEISFMPEFLSELVGCFSSRHYSIYRAINSLS